MVVVGTGVVVDVVVVVAVGVVSGGSVQSNEPYLFSQPYSQCPLLAGSLHSLTSKECSVLFCRYIMYYVYNISLNFFIRIICFSFSFWLFVSFYVVFCLS